MSAARYTKELESIASNAVLYSGEMGDILTEIGKKLTLCLEVERVNLWLFNDKDERIECVGNYTHSTDQFSQGHLLNMRDVPKYYAKLKSNKTLIVEDVYSSSITEEIAVSYCKPLGITAMLDIPIRIQGELRGLLCFEHKGSKRAWTDDEIHFSLAVSQVVALAMETTRRRKIQVELENAMVEKDLLLREMHHRTKNNLSILMSLLRMQRRESEDDEVSRVLLDCEARIFSMAKIHERLYKSGNYLDIRLDTYLLELLTESEISTGREIAYEYNLDPGKIEISRAIDLGLIVVEVLNNINKHAFNGTTNGQKRVLVHLQVSGTRSMLQISDNGIGFDPEKELSGTLGMSLIKDLAEQIDADLNIQSSSKGTSYTLRFESLPI